MVPCVQEICQHQQQITDNCLLCSTLLLDADNWCKTGLTYLQQQKTLWNYRDFWKFYLFKTDYLHKHVLIADMWGKKTMTLLFYILKKMKIPSLLPSPLLLNCTLQPACCHVLMLSWLLASKTSLILSFPSLGTGSLLKTPNGLVWLIYKGLNRQNYHKTS